MANNEAQAPEPSLPILIASQFSTATGTGSVRIKVGTMGVNATPPQARAVAVDILTAAANADADEFLVRYLVEELEVAPAMAATALVRARALRQGEDTEETPAIDSGSVARG